MKKIILLASIAFMVMTGCSKNQIIETPASQKEISFDSYLHRVTKASVNSKTEMQGGNTKLYSYLINSITGNYNDVEKRFFEETLTYSNLTWKTSNPRYWPSTMTESSATQSLSFFAYFPEGATNLTYSDNAFLNKTGYPSFEYEVPALVANQQDVLVSMAMNKVDKATGADVEFTFNHALAQIQIQIRIPYDSTTPCVKYEITEVTIGKDNGGVAKLKYKNTFTYGENFASSKWGTADEEVTSYTYPLTTRIIDYTDSSAISETPALADNSGYLMLLPQTLAAGTTIGVSYKVMDIDNNTVATFTNRKAVITGTWEKGTRYIYQLIMPSGLSLSPITYDVIDVRDWADGTSNYSFQ